MSRVMGNSRLIQMIQNSNIRIHFLNPLHRIAGTCPRHCWAKESIGGPRPNWQPHTSTFRITNQPMKDDLDFERKMECLEEKNWHAWGEYAQSIQRGPSWDSNHLLTEMWDCLPLHHCAAHNSIQKSESGTQTVSPTQAEGFMGQEGDQKLKMTAWVKGEAGPMQRLLGAIGGPKDLRRACWLRRTKTRWVRELTTIWQWKWDTPETCGEAWGWGGAASFSANPIYLPTTNCVSYFLLEFFPNS